MVAQEFPQVHVIENAENVGFAKANNQAIAKASGDYVLLLNPDTIVTPGSLDKLLACAKASPAAGVIGGKTLNRDGSIDYGCARHFPTIGGEFFNITRLNAAFPKNRIIGHYRMSYWDHNDTREVDCVIGACMLLKREMLEKIGYLDESYFMYVEDIEISYRAKMHGYKTVYCAGAQIYHFGAESSKQARQSMRLAGIRSMYEYFTKTRGKIYAILYLLMLPLAVLINRVQVLLSNSIPNQRYLGLLI